MFEADWTQFLPSVIATGIGFFLAIYGQIFLERRKKRVDARGLMERIKHELMTIKETLSNFKITHVHIDPLKTPAWDACINAGQVSLLGVEMREILFSVYNTIREFNSWNLIQTNLNFNTNTNGEIDVEINRLKEELEGSGKTSIQYVITCLKGGEKNGCA